MAFLLISYVYSQKIIMTKMKTFTQYEPYFEDFTKKLCV